MFANFKRAALLLVVSLSLGFMLSSALAAKPLQALTTHVVMDLPEGFKVSTTEAGFVDSANRTNITVVEYPPEAFDEMKKAFTIEAFALNGMTGGKLSRLDRPEDHVLITGQQKGSELEYDRFIMLTHEAQETTLVTVNVPAPVMQAGAITRTAVEAALKSVHRVASQAPEPNPIRLGYLGPFKPAGYLPGFTKAFTLDGKLVPPQEGEHRPLVIVSLQPSSEPPTDLEAKARLILQGLPGERHASELPAEKIKIGGRDAVAFAVPPAKIGSNDVDGVYQLMLALASGGTLLIVGMAGPNDYDRLLPEFRKIAQSFETGAP